MDECRYRRLEVAIRGLLGCLLLFCLMNQAFAQVHVQGYTRKDGTYVAPHVRSSPNASKADNYSSRGNFNPYTGARGTANPGPESYNPPAAYVPPVRQALIPTYQPTPSAVYQEAAASYEPATPPEPIAVVVYRCVDASGRRHYLAHPRAGCDAISVAQQPSPTAAWRKAGQLVGTQSYAGSCTQDCSGHDAGYAWAERRGIDDPDDCGGNSQSFIAGCQAWAEEQMSR